MSKWTLMYRSLDIFDILQFQGFFLFLKFIDCLRTSILCIVKELAEVGSVAVTVGVIDRWQVTSDTRHTTYDMWQLTPDTWKMTHDFFSFFLFLPFCPFYFVLVSVLPSAYVKRFSVSRFQDFVSGLLNLSNFCFTSLKMATWQESFILNLCSLLTHTANIIWHIYIIGNFSMSLLFLKYTMHLL